MTIPTVRRATVVPLTVPLTSPHGTTGVTAPQFTATPTPSTTGAAWYPATLTGDTLTFSVGPGTDIGALPPGRAYLYVRFLDGTAPVELAAGALDVDTGQITTPDDLAARLGLPTPLPDQTRAVLDAAIADAVADVEAYLGRPIAPTVHVERGVQTRTDGTWNLTQQPVVAVLSAVPDSPDGYVTLSGGYTITYLAGLDAANDPALAPIRRYVTAAAVNAPQALTVWRQTAGDAARSITTLSVEGQTVGYTPATLGGGGAAATDSPGALPSIKTLSRWKVAGRRAFQRPGTAPDPLDWMGWSIGRPWWR